MSPEAEEEIQLLSSIYSAGKESLTLLHSNFLQIQLCQPVALRITFEIPKDYPQSRPPILQGLEESLSRSSLNKAGCEIVESIYEPGEPCLYSVIEAIKDLLASSSSEEKALKEETSSERPVYFTLIELDHIRDEKRYTKALRLWIQELSLCGRLLFVGNRLLLLLRGESSASIKNFISHLRNNNVDVDSKGKPCKERLAKIICSLSSQEAEFVYASPIWSDGIPPFQVLKEAKLTLQSFLSQFNLIKLYDQYLI